MSIIAVFTLATSGYILLYTELRRRRAPGSFARCGKRAHRKLQAMVAAMMMNIYAAWVGFVLGCVAGATPGLFFHRETWLGGYSSWPRRMVRLAHIAFFGIGFLNLALALTARALGIESGLGAASALLIVGAATMPLVCYLSAWKAFMRNLFFIPTSAVTAGVALFTWRVFSL